MTNLSSTQTLKAKEPLLKKSRWARTACASLIVIGLIGEKARSFLTFLAENIDHDGNWDDDGWAGGSLSEGYEYTVNGDGGIHLSLTAQGMEAF